MSEASGKKLDSAALLIGRLTDYDRNSEIVQSWITELERFGWVFTGDGNPLTAHVKNEILNEIRSVLALSFMKAQANVGMTLKQRAEEGILASGPDPLLDLYLVLSDLSFYVKEIS